jgi:hypothetical protein
MVLLGSTLPGTVEGHQQHGNTAGYEYGRYIGFGSFAADKEQWAAVPRVYLTQILSTSQKRL